MRQFVVSILAVLYLGVSSGVAMEIHYCMGKVAGIELFGGEDERCGRCGMKEKKGGCCSDEYKFYKIQDAHKNVNNNINVDFHSDIVMVKKWQLQPACILSAQNTGGIRNNSPPPDTGPARRILYCTYRL